MRNQNPREASSRSRIFLISLVYMCISVFISVCICVTPPGQRKPIQTRLDFLHISSIASFSYLFTFVLKKVEYFFENFRVNEIFRPSNEIEIRKQYYLSIVHSNLSWIWHNRAFISVPNWHWSFWKLYRVNRGHSSIMSSSSGGGR